MCVVILVCVLMKEEDIYTSHTYTYLPRNIHGVTHDFIFIFLCSAVESLLVKDYSLLFSAYMMIMINIMNINILEGSRKRSLVKHNSLENKDMKNIETNPTHAAIRVDTSMYG